MAKGKNHLLVDVIPVHTLLLSARLDQMIHLSQVFVNKDIRNIFNRQEDFKLGKISSPSRSSCGRSSDHWKEPSLNPSEQTDDQRTKYFEPL